MKLSKALPLLLIVILFSIPCLSQDWPLWRGPQGNSYIADAEWNPKMLISQVSKAWEIQAGNGWSAVSVSDGKVYTMGNVDGQDVVYCLNEADGNELWRHSYDCPGGNFAGPRATPVVYDGLVYTVGRNGDVYALNPVSGKVVWHVNLMNEYGAQNITWGFSSSAVVEGEMIILNANKHGIALNRKTGAKVWASAPGKCGYASATLYTHGGTRYAAIFGEQAVYGVEAATGKLVWSHPWVTDYNVNAADPVYYQGKIFISSGYNRGCALLDISGAAPTVIYENKNMRAHFGSFVVKGKYLYGPDGDTGDAEAKITCLNIETGEIVWSKTVGNNALMAAGGHIIDISERGRLRIIELKPDAYVEVSNTEVLPTSRRNPSWTAPVLANGRIYCRNGNGQLAAIQMK